MKLAVIYALSASIEILDLTEEEDKILQELWDNNDDDLYEEAMEIAGKHGYNVWEQGVSVLVGDCITVGYESGLTMLSEL